MFFRNIAEFLAPIAPKVKHRLKKYENTFAYNTLKNTWKWFVNSSLVTGNLRRYVEKQQMIQDKYDLTELKKAKKSYWYLFLRNIPSMAAICRFFRWQPILECSCLIDLSCFVPFLRIGMALM